MGQVKGNPTPSYQNQGYEALYPNKNHYTEKSGITTPVMIDIDYRPAQAILSYGSFTDSTTQSASLANTPYSMKLNTIEGASGFTIENDNSGFPTRIKALRTGVYNLQYSAQLENTANTNIDFNIWLQYTGSNVTNSNGHVSLTKVSGEFSNLVSSWNYVLPIQQLDYVELKWMCNNTSGQIFASGSNGVRPATPSVIATITQVG
jgi:hypothetical protein